MTKFEDPSFPGYAGVRILKGLLKLMIAIIIHFFPRSEAYSSNGFDAFILEKHGSHTCRNASQLSRRDSHFEKHLSF